MGRSESYDLDDIPKHHKAGRRSGQKRFGIERWSRWRNEWYVRRWYPTEKQRDQALEDLKRHICSVYKIEGLRPQYRKVDR